MVMGDVDPEREGGVGQGLSRAMIPVSLSLPASVLSIDDAFVLCCCCVCVVYMLCCGTVRVVGVPLARFLTMDAYRGGEDVHSLRGQGIIWKVTSGS